MEYQGRVATFENNGNSLVAKRRDLLTIWPPALKRRAKLITTLGERLVKASFS